MGVHKTAVKLCLYCAVLCKLAHATCLTAGETFLTQLLLQRLCEAFAVPVLLQPLKRREGSPEKSDEPPAGAPVGRLAGDYSARHCPVSPL